VMGAAPLTSPAQARRNTSDGAALDGASSRPFAVPDLELPGSHLWIGLSFQEQFGWEQIVSLVSR
jgi:hypothetical protein